MIVHGGSPTEDKVTYKELARHADSNPKQGQPEEFKQQVVIFRRRDARATVT